MKRIDNLKITNTGAYSWGAFGSNPWMDIEIEGLGKTRVMRQGGLGIWAFPERDKLSCEEQRHLDTILTEAWGG